MHALAATEARVGFTLSDVDNMLSLRRWVKRSLAPTGDEPYVYIEPLEAQFIRPAITMRLIRTGLFGTRGQAARSTYDVELAVVATAYGRNRADTMTLAERFWRLFQDGGAGGAAFRIPMWNFAMNVKLDRMMRVPRGSLSMGLDATDDSGQWSRPIELQVQAPRLRAPRRAKEPQLAAIPISQTP
jgi:hypothetical protein